MEDHESAPLLQAPDHPAFRVSARRTILAVAMVQVTLSIGSYISLAAQLAILEGLVCRKYYAHEPRSCKVDSVQSDVAFINGWKDVFEMLPAIILAVPYGALADRIGRKKVLLLAIIGIGTNDLWVRLVFWFSDVFPVKAVWLGGLWQMIGAGAGSLSSITFVMVADVCPSDQRTTAFSRIVSAQILSQFLFVPIGGALSSIDPWLPMALSSVVTVLVFLGTLLLLPETLPPSQSPTYDQVVAPEVPPPGLATDAQGAKRSIAHNWYSLQTKMVGSARWVTRNLRLIVVLACVFPCSIGQQAGGSLLLQYASKRLDWSLSKASYLISLGAAVNLIVHAIGIPALSSFLLWRLNLHERSKDKMMAQISGFFLVAGTALAFAAGSWPLLALSQVLTSMGLVFAVMVRSLVAGMVPPKHLAALFTTMSVLLYGGSLTGGPLLAVAFGWGLRLGGIWLGMPFLVACICYGLAWMAVSSAPSNPLEQSS